MCARNVTNQLQASNPPLYAAHDCAGRVVCPFWHQGQDQEEAEQAILMRRAMPAGQ